MRATETLLAGEAKPAPVLLRDELADRRSEKVRAGQGESLREYAERLAAEAPPLSPERMARLAVLLGLGSASNQRKANRITDSNPANVAEVAA
jgi:hypothetical protein